MLRRIKERIKSVGRNIVLEGIAKYFNNNPELLFKSENTRGVTLSESDLRRVHDWRTWSKDFFLNDLVNMKHEFIEAYNMFEDNDSKKVFDWLIAYRTLMPIFGDPGIWSNHKPSLLYHLIPGTTSVTEFYKSFPLAVEQQNDYCLYVDKSAIWLTFFAEMYRYDELFQYKNGFVIFDLGGFFGDSAHFFSRLIGEKGKVYSFEPSQWNLGYMRENIKTFNLKNVEVIEKLVSDINGYVSFEEEGAAGRVVEEGVGDSIESITIDNFVSSRKDTIKRIDVIKMDIEGSELAALKGASVTIQNYKPIMLIAVYHGDDMGAGCYGYRDFIPLCLYLKTIDNYSFHLRHKNIGRCETVVVCLPKGRIADEN